MNSYTCTCTITHILVWLFRRASCQTVDVILIYLNLLLYFSKRNLIYSDRHLPCTPSLKDIVKTDALAWQVVYNSNNFLQEKAVEARWYIKLRTAVPDTDLGSAVPLFIDAVACLPFPRAQLFSSSLLLIAWWSPKYFLIINMMISH
jgi:hypothetical protein